MELESSLTHASGIGQKHIQVQNTLFKADSRRWTPWAGLPSVPRVEQLVVQLETEKQWLSVPVAWLLEAWR